ncbi:hypothetical protein Pfo_021248 [Paulownia fortunei]|nr:hypothetical protein Pfo_021248 [Paulownia fortunei]
MNFQAMIVQVTLLGMISLATEILSSPVPKPGCPTSCGNLTIPFPFGTSSDCHLDDSFLITCSYSYNPPKPFLTSSSIEVLDISLDGQITVSSSVASDCYDKSGSQISGTVSELTSSKFLISSTKNKFTAVGCDTNALVESSGEGQLTAVYMSRCDSIESVVNGTCSGIGCCQTSIPKGMKDFLVDIRSFRNHARVKTFNPCGYAFVVEAEAFNFSSLDLKDLQNRKTVPVVLDWSVGVETCQMAKNLSSYACQATHSECSNSSSGLGYHCNCLSGFEGNPYLVDGCQDIDECTALKPCEGMCTNLLGSYSCSCPDGYEGDGKKDGSGCHPKNQTNGSTLFYLASGFLLPAVGSSWIFWRRKQKKLSKLRNNLYRRNGERTPEVFTAADLKMATDNYNESRVLYRDEHDRIICKGILPVLGRKQLVAIKNCEALDQLQVEDFINKMVSLSQINHRNVVRLIGCCLETRIPLLVYEFIAGKTLYDCIHGEGRASCLSWEIRLKIATQTAGALAFCCISYSWKMCDFGFTRFSGSSEIPFCRLVGVAGYWDPECFLTGRLTEKSDVYSFGVVLAELLTGQKVVSFDRPEAEVYLAHYFVSSIQEGHLWSILDNQMMIDDEIEQLTKVAKLAERCLSSSSMDRPTMEEVTMALVGATSISSSSTNIRPNSRLPTTTQEF